MRLSSETSRMIILTVLSGCFLALSIFTDISFMGIDPAWGAIIASGVPIVKGAFYMLIFHKDIKADLLVSLALISCVIVGEYFAAGEVAFIMKIGEILEDYTVDRSRKGLKNLIDLRPSKARVLKDGDYVIIDSDLVAQGDKVRIIPGESIPVDGVIIEGETSIDQSVMTGESVPVSKNIGDEVFSATTNTNGTILIEATNVGEDSSISRMIRLIKEAEENRAPIISIMDKWASYLVVIALFFSVLIGFITQDMIRAITVLVIFCPCALVLATPTAIAAGIGNATKHGIIIKSGEALERLGNVVRVAFDKTGTLTSGVPEVNHVFINDSAQTSMQIFLQLVGSAETLSEHPFGKAITRYAAGNGTQLYEPSSFEVSPGKGIISTVSDHSVIVGNEDLIKMKGLQIPFDLMNQMHAENEKSNTSIYAAIDLEVVGLISLSDRIRDDSSSIVREIQELGAAICLITGDNEKVAQKIANEVGIDSFQASALPEDKMRIIKEYELRGEKTCMVGDGINDAPALKTAYMSVALAGIGSDLAAESADIVLVKDDIAKLPYIMKLSRRVIKKINQNIAISMIINFGAIGLAGLGFLNPVTGALVHNFGSVLVMINAAFLLNSRE